MGIGTRSYSKIIQDSLNWAIAYHGSKRANPAFTIPGFNQSKFKADGLLFGPGHYFTNNAEVIAGGYAGKTELRHVHKVYKNKEKAERVAKRFGGQRRLDQFTLSEPFVEDEYHFHYTKADKHSNPNIHKVTVDLKNPFNIDKGFYDTGSSEVKKLMSEVGMPEDFFRSGKSDIGLDPSQPFADLFAADAGMEMKLSGRDLYGELVKYQMSKDIHNSGDIKTNAKYKVNAALERSGFDGITHTGGGIWQDELFHDVSIAFNQSQVRPYWEAMAEVSAARNVRTRARNKIFLNSKTAERIEKQSTVAHRSIGRKLAEISQRGNKERNWSVSFVKTLGGILSPDRNLKWEDGWYHGSTKVFKNFNINRMRKGNVTTSIPAAFFSSDPEFANQYTGAYDFNSLEEAHAAGVRPNNKIVQVGYRKAWDHRIPEHRELIADRVVARKIAAHTEAHRLNPTSTRPIAEYAADARKSVDMMLKHGSWGFIEPEFEHIKSLGFDAVKFTEQGKLNLAVFSNNQIRNKFAHASTSLSKKITGFGGRIGRMLNNRGSSTIKSSIAMLAASASFGLGAPTLMNMTDAGHSILTTGGVGHTRLMEEDRARALVKKSFPLLYKDAKMHGKAMPTSIPPIYEMDKPNKEYFAKRETNPMIRGDYIHVDPSDKNIVSSTGHEMRHAFQASTFDNESAFNKAYSGDTTKFGLQKNRFELDASNVEKRLASGEFISPSMEREALQYLEKMPYRRPSLLPKTAISVSAGSVSNTIKQSGTTNRGNLYKLLGKIK